MILDKAEGGFIGTDQIGTEALAPAFFTIIFFRQGIAAAAKWPHDQFPIFQLGKKIIIFAFLGFFIVMGHQSVLLGNNTYITSKNK
jgi:hypothetical protein